VPPMSVARPIAADEEWFLSVITAPAATLEDTCPCVLLSAGAGAVDRARNQALHRRNRANWFGSVPDTST
jgi:hypothetical protein